ncbi:hypothetical protein JIG36_02810 [Actinoplanes sp. LDG1-06]|uniref:Uncharacterized protein n=1 Tax=Paractinoplanes ovalisporus TaxID=2810368 RepID=A0ABS2A3S0_9ACTN|nr:hypothetical protein [Actinoplanes ovalisporus]MBM2614490.1 hypothetical protein [Actinoplanes ovalisporus]
MNRVTRLLAIAGLGLGTVTIAAAPAQAATGTAQGASSTTSSASSSYRGWDDDEVVGYFRSLRTCERVGRIGEIRDRWDDYDCDRVRGGFGRGAWVLTVEDWNDNWDNDNWYYGGVYNNWRGGDWRGAWTHWFHRR